MLKNEERTSFTCKEDDCYCFDCWQMLSLGNYNMTKCLSAHTSGYECSRPKGHVSGPHAAFFSRHRDCSASWPAPQGTLDEMKAYNEQAQREPCRCPNCISITRTSQYCGHRHPDMRWTCTLRRGHERQHELWGPGHQQLGRWDSETTTITPFTPPWRATALAFPRQTVVEIVLQERMLSATSYEIWRDLLDSEEFSCWTCGEWYPTTDVVAWSDPDLTGIYPVYPLCYNCCTSANAGNFTPGSTRAPATDSEEDEEEDRDP